jgi:hypothetical protein
LDFWQTYRAMSLHEAARELNEIPEISNRISPSSPPSKQQPPSSQPAKMADS